MAEWYYIGHYGQLGPLSLDQMEELIQGGVIVRDTFVWKSGSSDWVQAEKSEELIGYFASLPGYMAAPPPAPSPKPTPFQQSPQLMSQPQANYGRLMPLNQSDRNAVLGGVLQLIPGVGRIYLGYAAIGVLQIVVFFMTCGIGWLWSFIDGIVILSGGVKYDGFGRRLGPS
ncbi:MAG: DUF4339 domain-containing protein [Armatimonadetes bacterium]|nr:DUF4339 domain-containing protein [Armatimonadota bacterium]